MIHRSRVSPTPSCILALLVLAMAALPASAQRSVPLSLGIRALDSQPNARLELHIVPADLDLDSSAVCAAAPRLECREGVKSFVTEAPLSTPEVPLYFAYVIVSGYDTGYGFAGVQFGIRYDEKPHSGVDIYDWTPCSVLEFAMSDWPASGSGDMLTWFPDHPLARAPCPREGTTVVGYFTIAVFSPDVLDLTPRPVDNALKVADCEKSETLLPASAAGAAGFGGIPGEDPCFSPPPPPPAPVQSVRAPEEPILALHAVPVSDAPAGVCGATPPLCFGGSGLNTRVALPENGEAETVVYLVVDAPRDAVRELMFDLDLQPGLKLESAGGCDLDFSHQTIWARNGPQVRISFSAGVGCCRGPKALAYFRISATRKAVFTLANVKMALAGSRAGSPWTPGPPTVGAIGFGGAPGVDPCLVAGTTSYGTPPAPRQLTTWGALKALYR